MRAEEIKIVRRLFKLTEGMSDQEILGYEKTLDDMPRTGSITRVGNFIEKLELRKKWMVGNWDPSLPYTDTEHAWLRVCEELFIEGDYGPCCVWARATMEHILQEDCLANPNVPEAFKKRIRGPSDKDPNPNLGELKEKLSAGGALTNADSEAIRVLAKNGKGSAHHRWDIITADRSIEDHLRDFGVDEENIHLPAFKESEGVLIKEIRFRGERRMAVESLRELYRIFSSRRQPRR
jgi:hypothetical protein